MARTGAFGPQEEGITQIDVSAPCEGDPTRDRTRRQQIPLRSPYYDPFSAETRRVPSPYAADAPAGAAPEPGEAPIPLVRVLRESWVHRLPAAARATLEAARLGDPVRPTARVTCPVGPRSPRIPSLPR